MKYNIALLSVIVLLSSCYRDKGNYDYHDITEGIILNMPDEYTVMRFENIVIEPQMKTVNGDAGYTYRWILYGGSYSLGEISDQRTLDYTFSRPAGMRYHLIFSATSDVTGMEYRKMIPLTVTTASQQGYYVLKTVNGKTDMDFFSDDGQTEVPDFLLNSHGYQLEGEAGRISYVEDYREFKNPDDPAEGLEYTKRFFVTSSDDIIVFDQSNALITRFKEDIFYILPENLKPTAMVQGIEDFHLINDGKIYKIVANRTNVGRFAGALTHPLGANYDYDLFPLTTGYRYGTTPVLFDRTSRSFMYTPWMTYEMLRMEDDWYGVGSLCDMDYDLMYMGLQDRGLFQQYVFALMKHVSDGSYRIYKIVADDYMMMYMAEAVYDVPATSGLIDAPFRAMHAKMDVIYYTEGNKIMLYNIRDGSESEIHTIPEGEQFTTLRMQWDLRRVQDQEPPLLLTWATQRGDSYTYTLSYFDDNTGRPTETLATLEGKGRAVDYKHGLTEDLTFNY